MANMLLRRNGRRDRALTFEAPNQTTGKVGVRWMVCDALSSAWKTTMLAIVMLSAAHVLSTFWDQNVFIRALHDTLEQAQSF